MAYEPTVWKSGDIVSSERLNKMENGIETLNFFNDIPRMEIVIDWTTMTTPNDKPEAYATIKRGEYYGSIEEAYNGGYLNNSNSSYNILVKIQEKFSDDNIKTTNLGFGRTNLTFNSTNGSPNGAYIKVLSFMSVIDYSDQETEKAGGLIKLFTYTAETNKLIYEHQYMNKIDTAWTFNQIN